MMNKKENISDLITPLIRIGMMASISGLILGGMNKMFGENEKIPKGVVKELMEGVLSGLTEQFRRDLNELKSDKEELEKKIEELERDLEFVNKWKERYDEVIASIPNKKVKKKKKN